ncbi:MAG: hypothetical protein EOO38_02265 [Cytophagaceae bacterium]|nr:MAG: hypothetical protein EOO38_02265 [Cytophagaceae bacterium]
METGVDALLEFRVTTALVRSYKRTLVGLAQIGVNGVPARHIGVVFGKPLTVTTSSRQLDKKASIFQHIFQRAKTVFDIETRATFSNDNPT